MGVCLRGAEIASYYFILKETCFENNKYCPTCAYMQVNEYTKLLQEEKSAGSSSCQVPHTLGESLYFVPPAFLKFP